MIYFEWENHGITVVAGQQTNGVGRGKNKWISPFGSLLFSTTFKFVNQSPIYNHPSIVQHFLCLATVIAIKRCSINDLMEIDESSSQFKDLPIGIKWPNDIYYNGQSKLGGILVNSYLQGPKLNSVLSNLFFYFNL